MFPLEIMKKIAETEKEAHQLQDSAAREVTHMKGDLAERIASMRQTMLREATEHRERAIAAAERAGAQEANSISADLRKRVDELTRIPDAKRKKAVRRAVELVLS